MMRYEIIHTSDIANTEYAEQYPDMYLVYDNLNDQDVYIDGEYNLAVFNTEHEAQRFIDRELGEKK